MNKILQVGQMMSQHAKTQGLEVVQMKFTERMAEGFQCTPMRTGRFVLGETNITCACMVCLMDSMALKFLILL